MDNSNFGSKAEFIKCRDAVDSRKAIFKCSNNRNLSCNNSISVNTDTYCRWKAVTDSLRMS